MGLQSPYSFLADPSSKGYFISNMNGEPDARDNNGFITKLDEEGKVTTLKFIAGGEGSVELHAPKGMALADQVLYVADLDMLRGFNKNTGKPVVSVPMPNAPNTPRGQVIALADVASNGKGLLYISDTTGNTIYKVDIARQHAVTVFFHDERLAGPSGVAVHPKSGHLIVVSWEKGKIFDITPEGALTELVSNGFFSSRFQNLSGVDFDRWGNMYVSDQTKGKIWRMTHDARFQVIAEYLPAPADISVDRANNLILVPYQYVHAAEINGLESPSEPNAKSQKRTLADYGFIPPPPKPESAGEGKR
ncbi:MAG: hypothetical protein ACT4OO_00405 [Nitrospiraceae bacterium]